MSRTVVVGTPGRVPRIEDVVQVAKDGGADWMQASGQQSVRANSELPAARVGIHPSAKERMETEMSGNSNTRELSWEELETELPPIDETAPLLTGMQTRAIMFVRLLTIASGRTGIRPEVAQRLADCLNATHDIRVRASGRDESVLSEILRLIARPDQDKPVTLTTLEKDVLMCGQIPTVGLGAITVVAAKGLQKMSLAVCALTCETIQADISDIDEDKVAHVCSGDAVKVAMSVRDLLEGSERVGSQQGRSVTTEAISLVPAVHGELEAAITRCDDSVTAALRSIPTNPVLFIRLGPTIGLPIALLYMSTLLVRAAELSVARAEMVAKTVHDNNWITHELRSVEQFFYHASALRDAAQTVMAAEVGKACFAGALAAWAGVTALLNALAMESALLLLSLREQEIPMRDAPLSNNDSHLSPRQKRKNSRDDGPALGIGTARFRLLLEDAVTDFKKIQPVVQQMAALTGGAIITEPQLRLQALLAALDPIGEQLPREMAELQHILQAHVKAKKATIPPGTKEYDPPQIAVRDAALAKIYRVFQRHGALPLDTPALENCHNISCYGENSKQVFEIKSNEIMSLRYDLTISFARYVAHHNLSHLKRYQLAKVYRKEDADPHAERLREFHQLDFDVAGNSPRMMADAEVLKVLTEVLRKVKIRNYRVRINHRLLLIGILRLFNVPRHKHDALLQIIDRHSGEKWDDVEKQLHEALLLDPQVVNKIVGFVSREGEPWQLLQELRKPEANLAGIDSCSSALSDLETLFHLLESMDVLQHFVLDLSIAGALDYYTGMVFEVFDTENHIQGAIAAGGRYDGLIGSFGQKQVRAVGFSIGFDRIFPALEQNSKTEENATPTFIQVLVMSVGKDMQQERLKLASQLWDRDIGAEFTFSKANPFLPEQMSHATSSGIPLAIIMAPRELAEGKVEIMDVATGQRDFVSTSDVISTIEERLLHMAPQKFPN